MIAEPCIGTKDNSCVEVCPVDCIHPTPDEAGHDAVEMLFIDPDECIDCDACVEACPVDAIFAEDNSRLSGPTTRRSTPTTTRRRWVRPAGIRTCRDVESARGGPGQPSRAGECGGQIVQAGRNSNFPLEAESGDGFRVLRPDPGRSLPLAPSARADAARRGPGRQSVDLTAGPEEPPLELRQGERFALEAHSPTAS